MSDLEIRRAVKERYSKLAKSLDSSRGENCCAPRLVLIGQQLPPEVFSISAGCGSPLAIVKPKNGDTILDLGSGGGIDIFRASQMVGARGKAIGVDATPEMIWRAREIKAKYGDKYSNVEFRLGEIEHLPIESKSVDFVISNCVINLSPDKLAVFKESFRVLKEGGTFAVADVTLPREIPETARKDMNSWTACVAGALTDSEYAELLRSAGFGDIHIVHVSNTNIGECESPYHSSHIRARKS